MAMIINKYDLLLAKKNSIEMMKRRGYKIPDTDYKFLYDYPNEIATIKPNAIPQILSEIYYPKSWQYKEFELMGIEKKDEFTPREYEISNEVVGYFRKEKSSTESTGSNDNITIVYFLGPSKSKNIDTEAWKQVKDYITINVSFNLASIQKLNVKNKESKLDRLNINIILVTNKIFPSALEEERKNLEASVFLTLMKYSQLKIDPQNNWLVPKHILCTPDEEKELLKGVAIETYKLPRILKLEPQSVYMNFPRGKMIKILRDDENIGVNYIEKMSTYYRIVHQS
jgi:DNA-directed RNA polymerase subunit H (RpoH/RPB5)